MAVLSWLVYLLTLTVLQEMKYELRKPAGRSMKKKVIRSGYQYQNSPFDDNALQNKWVTRIRDMIAQDEYGWYRKQPLPTICCPYYISHLLSLYILT